MLLDVDELPHVRAVIDLLGYDHKLGLTYCRLFGCADAVSDAFWLREHAQNAMESLRVSGFVYMPHADSNQFGEMAAMLRTELEAMKETGSNAKVEAYRSALRYPKRSGERLARGLTRA